MNDVAERSEHKLGCITGRIAGGVEVACEHAVYVQTEGTHPLIGLRLPVELLVGVGGRQAKH